MLGLYKNVRPICEHIETSIMHLSRMDAAMSKNLFKAFIKESLSNVLLFLSQSQYRTMSM